MSDNFARVTGARTFIARRTGRANDRDTLPDDLALGPAGLGLDSVSIVELLLACEEAFGARFDATLLEREPLTVGALVAWINGAAGVGP